jgi:hypothetical protein
VKNIVILGASLMALAACAPQVPNSGQGVGFSDYAEYELERARREAQLRGEPLDVRTAAANTGVTNDGVISTEELARAGIDTEAEVPAGQAGVPIGMTATDTTTGADTAQTPLASNPEISDEQDFSAVASRESIESDAERRARQAAACTAIKQQQLKNGGPR